MMGAELVGPLRQVSFHDGTKIVADPPRDTFDLRWVLCADHRTACDCREAEFAEEQTEYWAHLEHLSAEARRVLAGHAVATCGCTGCRLVRGGHVPSVWVDRDGFVMPPGEGE